MEGNAAAREEHGGQELIGGGRKGSGGQEEVSGEGALGEGAGGSDRRRAAFSGTEEAREVPVGGFTRAKEKKHVQPGRGYHRRHSATRGVSHGRH